MLAVLALLDGGNRFDLLKIKLLTVGPELHLPLSGHMMIYINPKALFCNQSFLHLLQSFR